MKLSYLIPVIGVAVLSLGTAAMISTIPAVPELPLTEGYLFNKWIPELLKPQGQHGPDVKCKQWCAPAGFEDEAEPPEGIPVVTCAGSTGINEKSWARQGVQCGKQHRPGCSEHCRDQCCSCCSI